MQPHHLAYSQKQLISIHHPSWQSLKRAFAHVQCQSLASIAPDRGKINCFLFRGIAVIAGMDRQRNNDGFIAGMCGWHQFADSGNCSGFRSRAPEHGRPGCVAICPQTRREYAGFSVKRERLRMLEAIGYLLAGTSCTLILGVRRATIFPIFLRETHRRPQQRQ